MKKSALISVFLITSLIFVLSCQNSEPQEKPQQVETSRQEAIDFTLIGLDGIERTLSEQKGNVVVVDFWATWCAPCKVEIPHLQQLYTSYKDQGLVMWGVGLDREDKLRDFANENDIEYPILIGNNELPKKYDVQGIPTTFLFDKNNRIAFRHVGFAPGMEKDLENEISQLLKE